MQDHLADKSEDLVASSHELWERSERALAKSEELLEMVDGTNERNKIYREGFEMLYWLVYQPGYVKKGDLKAVLAEISKRIGKSLVKDVEKLFPEGQNVAENAENVAESS